MHNLKENKILNLNKGETLKIEELRNGKTQSIEVRLGRKLYYIDVDKHMTCASIDFYKKVCKDRTKQSKYDDNMIASAVFVKNSAVLGKTFFEHISEFEKAVATVRTFRHELFL